jgi:hypothetical protein
MVQSSVLQAGTIDFVNFGYNTDTNIHRAFFIYQVLHPVTLIGQHAASDHVISSFISALAGIHLCSCIQASVPVITALTR